MLAMNLLSILESGSVGCLSGSLASAGSGVDSDVSAFPDAGAGCGVVGAGAAPGA